MRQERGQLMKKNRYIFTGSKLYKITKVDNELISVIPTAKKMTHKLASKTYHKAQLESLGYIIC